MEDKIANEITGSEKNEKLWVSNEKESKEQIKNEFEEKMKVEKKRFQETLNSMRQEIERLQKERSKAMNEISTKQGDSLKQVIISLDKVNERHLCTCLYCSA
jgi:flagellar hook-basal body complex protein FliE